MNPMNKGEGGAGWLISCVEMLREDFAKSKAKRKASCGSVYATGGFRDTSSAGNIRSDDTSWISIVPK